MKYLDRGHGDLTNQARTIIICLEVKDLLQSCVGDNILSTTSLYVFPT